jgi:hypothetical protein
METQIRQKTKVGVLIGILVGLAILIIAAFAIKPPQNPNDNLPSNERANSNS